MLVLHVRPTLEEPEPETEGFGNPILKFSKVELLPKGLDIRFLSHKVVSLQGLASILEPNLRRIDNGNYNPFIKCDCSDNVIRHITVLQLRLF
ncbi:uncharacterized protein LOC133719782 isoform X2 [Rosa rugosa]|uniref:uncharacterized protein LOC133719782 isoform X2 n=1 Tax=Rosa rugosa TaxID=74645 RepID=UPI002B413D97|nr:uncharacterized protein LOC133719782 isoform X2 [Rosa rugosa]